MLHKMVADHQREWHDRLLNVLWTYQTSAHLSMGGAPFLLVYGTEANLPMKVELMALLMVTISQLSPEQVEHVENRIASFEAIDEH